MLQPLQWASSLSSTSHDPRRSIRATSCLGLLVICWRRCRTDRVFSWLHCVWGPRHSAYVKKLGAHETFDYSDSLVVGNVTQSLNTANEHAVLAYDTISEHGSAPMCAEVLEAFGGGKLCLTLLYPEDVKKPEGVKISSTYSARVTTDSQDFGRWLFNEWLEKSLADKTYVSSPAIEKVDGGIQAMQMALNIHKKGLSGKKLVLTV